MRCYPYAQLSRNSEEATPPQLKPNAVSVPEVGRLGLAMKLEMNGQRNQLEAQLR